MERIASFTVDHNKLLPGLYFSRRDGDIVTFDLRFKRPNTGDLLTNSEMHSTEHLIATLLRNSEDKEAVIYFGPMGCQTGFYFLFDNRLLSCEGAIALLQEVFTAAAAFEGEIPGKSAAECGNYANLDLETGKAVCAFYAELIRDWTVEKLSY
jgi:S-ribosylhomocysteine lyase